MIRSRSDYLSYLQADRVALNKRRRRPKLFGDEVWKFQRALRAVEYYTNCGTRFNLPARLFWRMRLHRLALECNFTIAPNTFGPGLAIAHRGTIVVNGQAKIGPNCRIHPGATIGASGGEADAVPRIGAGVYIGPGAKIFGRIELADGIAVAANSVVQHSFTEPGIVIGGAPARKIGERSPHAPPGGDNALKQAV